MDSYPCAPVEGVDPVFVPHMLRGAMTLRYLKRVPTLTQVEAADAAAATWDTEWESDPTPRNFFSAVEAVDSDLEHWDEA